MSTVVFNLVTFALPVIREKALNSLGSSYPSNNMPEQNCRQRPNKVGIPPFSQS